MTRSYVLLLTSDNYTRVPFDDAIIDRDIQCYVAFTRMIIV